MHPSTSPPDRPPPSNANPFNWPMTPNKEQIPLEVLQRIIRNTTRQSQSRLMRSSKTLYQLTAPILYFQIPFDLNKRATVFDGLPLEKWVQPLWSKKEGPPSNRKRELLKMVKIVEIFDHSHFGHTGCSIDFSRIEFGLPKLSTIVVKGYCTEDPCPIWKALNGQQHVAGLEDKDIQRNRAAALVPSRRSKMKNKAVIGSTVSPRMGIPSRVPIVITRPLTDCTSLSWSAIRDHLWALDRFDLVEFIGIEQWAYSTGSHPPKMTDKDKTCLKLLCFSNLRRGMLSEAAMEDQWKRVSFLSMVEWMEREKGRGLVPEEFWVAKEKGYYRQYSGGSEGLQRANLEWSQL